MPLFAFFLYKKHTKIGKKMHKIQKITCEKSSTDCFHFVLSNRIVCDDILPFVLEFEKQTWIL